MRNKTYRFGNVINLYLEINLLRYSRRLGLSKSAVANGFIFEEGFLDFHFLKESGAASPVVIIDLWQPFDCPLVTQSCPCPILLAGSFRGFCRAKSSSERGKYFFDTIKECDTSINTFYGCLDKFPIW